MKVIEAVLFYVCLLFVHMMYVPTIKHIECGCWEVMIDSQTSFSLPTVPVWVVTKTLKLQKVIGSWKFITLMYVLHV